MDKYVKAEKPKVDTPLAENEIRINSMGRARAYITYAMSLLQENKYNEVTFMAMGRAINKAVTIAELIKRRIPGIHQNTSIGSLDITDTWEPTEEGLLPIETTRHVSAITITLSKEQLNTSSVGYQCPIPLEMVKPLAEIDFEGRDGSPRGRGGRGRGGRPRGGRGQYVNNAEYDDGGMEQERFTGRGRGGRGRGGRRGRGGYNGPQPHYEAQQDGGDYGYNGPPHHHQQDHGYDDGGMEQERSFGRGGRGGLRGRGGFRGGRGRRGGFNGPPQHFEGQQDGGDYGYNNAPPREYDDGNQQRSYGGGRGRGGRGRGGFNGPPPPQYEGQQDGADYGFNAPPQSRGGRGGRGRRGGARGGFARSDGPQ